MGIGVFTGLGVLPGAAVITTSPRGVGSAVGAVVSAAVGEDLGVSFFPHPDARISNMPKKTESKRFICEMHPLFDIILQFHLNV